MRQHLRKSVNVLICLSLLLGSLGPGDPGPGTSALAAPADDSSDGVPSSALPIGNWPDLVAAAPAASSTITLAASGFTPAVVTVSMGSEVAWYNATGQTHVVRSGVPYRAYLPLVVRGASSSAAAERTAWASGGRVAVSGGEAFTGTIPPGGTFTHTFASAGQFPYFAATAPAFQGRVIVQSSGLPPDPATVAPPVDPSVPTDIASATEFLYTGENPIQTGVLPGTMEITRVAVLRGRVLSSEGTPISGTQVAILNHPEFGQTLTRLDGMFDLAVNGGGRLTVNYQRDGYLPVQRKIDVPWRDFSWLPDVVLIPVDPHVTAIDAASSAIQVAQGSVITDSSGTRQATLLIMTGTQATMIFAGGLTETLPAFHVRLTEYTAGESGPRAMPGELPPQSGYTYAAEYSVDEAVAAGALNVAFSQPLIHYSHNFLTFTVGTAVPAGYYDRVNSQWVASPNGRVIKIVAITDSVAYLDTDTTAGIDNGVALGVTLAERQTLGTLYPEGQTLWRVPISHFSPWDCNWPYGPPSDAVAPSQPPPIPEESPLPVDCDKKGSMIGCESQRLGEAAGLAGTPFRLHYSSDRVPGGTTAAYRLRIPLSGSSLPASLKRIDLEITVAGRTFRQAFSPALNLSYTFIWDGKDAYGRTLQGSHPARVRIGYVYDAVYRTPSQLVQAFGQFGPAITAVRARSEVVIWQEWEGLLGAMDMRGVGLGGWDLNVHHTYDSGGHLLYLGDGTRRSAEGQSFWVISTVAGTGASPSTGDGLPATQAGVWQPIAVSVAPNGAFYVIEMAGNRVRRVGTDGIITTVAGIYTTTGGYNGDGIPATSAQLNYPTGLAAGPDGSLYIADSQNHRVRRVGPDGIISTVAGTGAAAFGGDGGPAVAAQLNRPGAVAVGPDGSLYIADGLNYRVRRVSPDGIITTVAGNGSQCPIPRTQPCGDGGLATLAQITWPDTLAVGSDGRLYIGASNDARIRRVGTDGIIRTVAGTGAQGTTGDGGPATSALLWSPNGLTVGPDGSFYISDSGGPRRIRRVGPDGIITTVAGGLTGGYNGDGMLATQALLNNPYGVSVAPDGSLYIADRSNNRVRRVVPALTGFSASDSLIPSEDGSEVYHFAASGRHLRTLNALTGAVRYQFAYDSAGRLASVTDGDGNATSIERDPSGVPTAVVGPHGQRTTLQLDGNGYLSLIAGPGGQTLQLESAPDGLLASLTDPRDGLHEYTFDEDGRLIQDDEPGDGFKSLSRVDGSSGFTITVSTALGRQTTYQAERLPAGGARRTTTDPAGAKTVAVFGADGSQSVTYPDGTLVTLKIGPDPRWGMVAPIETSLVITTPGGLVSTRTMSRVASVPDKQYPFNSITLLDTINQAGSVFTSRYVGDTRTITNTSAAGRLSVATLDARGRVTRIARDGEDPVTLTYDSQGRFVARQQGVYSTTYAYDDSGTVAARTVVGSGQTRYEYDAGGRLTETTLPSNNLYRFGYDADSNLTRVTPPITNTHALTYTVAGRQSAYSPPGGAAYGWSYNPDGGLTEAILPGSVTQTHGTDAGGRTTSISYPSAAITFVYTDSTSRVRGIVHAPAGPGASQSISFTYAGGYVIGLDWSGVATGTYTYTYGANTRLTGITRDADPKITLGYDADGLLTQDGPFVFTRGGPRGNPTLISDGSYTGTYAYDSHAAFSGRGAAVAGQDLYQEQLEYDSAGRIWQKTETVLGATRTYTYTFDADGQLLEVWQDGTVSEQYGYDANGNRTSRQLGANPVVTATYDIQDRLIQQGGVSHQFDDAGFLVQRGTGDTFQYSARGELLQAEVGGQTVTYAYDGLGRRVGRTDAGGTTRYLYGHPEYPFRITASRDPSGVATVYTYDEGGRMFALRRGDALYYVASDLLGTPRLVADAGGTVTKSLEYDAFGRLLSDSNPAFDLQVGFAGGLADGVTGLVRFGARDYDPEAGRWTARDPVLFRGHQVNLYAYVGNNPVQMVDPWGVWSIGGSVYALVGGGGNLNCTWDGCSLCLEVGIGLGTEIVVDPFAGLAEEGTSINSEVGGALGPVASAKWTAKNTLDGCPTEHGWEVCALVWCVGSDTKWGQLKLNPGELPNAEQIYKKAKFGVEAKEFYQRCERYMW